MTDETKNGGQLPVGSFAAIAVFIAGVLLSPDHGLTPTRPPSQHAKHGHPRYIQDIPARLWEDPLAATTLEPAPIELVGSLAGPRRWIAAREASRSNDETSGVARGGAVVDHTSDRKDRLLEFRTQMTWTPACTWFMPVMVKGGPYGEDSEHRRRTRYAVVSALQRSRLVPDDNEHIGVFETALAYGGTAQPIRIPFESYTLEGGSPPSPACEKPERVIVLWLDEGAFQSRPIANLASVVDLLTHAYPPYIRRVVLIGPVMSQTLKAMLRELPVKDGEDNWSEALPRLEIFASSPTAPNHNLGFDNGETPAMFAASRDVTLLRPMVDDARLMERMFEELKLRGVDFGKDRIAFVSEADTGYGRTLSGAVKKTTKTANAAKTVKPASTADCEGSGPGKPLEFHYLRGLDGETAQAASAAKTEGSEQPKELKKQTERPSVGLHQLDYAQRVARTIRARQEALRECGSRIAAIGVLGHDFYDKALLIQALKKEMPTALLFTTDLDARMADSNQVQWTRNLLVASGFGLQLHPRLQDPVAPFRDSYQTAAFFSTLLALRAYAENSQLGTAFEPGNAGAIDSWLSDTMEARVYEIGRREILDLGPGFSTRYPCKPKGPVQCASVSPPPSDLGVPGWHVLAVILVPIVILLMTTSRFVWDTVAEAIHQRWPAAIAVFVLLMLASAFGAVVLRDGAQGEPFRWAQGVSAWPTLILRSLALMLTLYFFYKLWNENNRAIEPLVCQYYHGPSQLTSKSALPSAPTLRDHLVAALKNRRNGSLVLERTRYVLAGLRTRLATAWQSPILIDKWRNQKYSDGATSSTVIREYCAMSRNWRRLIRTGINTLAYLIVCFGLLKLFDEPNEPFRGNGILVLHYGILYSLIVGYTAVLFLTVDTVRLFSAFIARMSSVKSDWPVESLAKRLQVPPEILEQYGREWLNIQFIAERADHLHRIVYYPFIILAIAAVARSTLFDNWYMPPSLVVILLMGAVFSAYCALGMRKNAAEAQRKALEAMESMLASTRAVAAYQDCPLGENAAKHARELSVAQWLKDDVARIRRGPFAPLSEQPFWKALLIPLTGFGGTELLQYLLAASS